MRTPIKQQLATANPYLKAFAMQLTNNPTDAEDLYQETAIRILSNLNLFEVGTNFRAWAMTIMRNIFINDYRKKTRRRSILSRTKDYLSLNTTKIVQENAGESNMGYAELMKMVNQLSEDFRTPFLLAYQGYRYEEIAEHINAPLGTVKSRIFFARKKLQTIYKQANLERRA